MKVLLFSALPREPATLLGTFDTVKRLKDFPFRTFFCRHPLHEVFVVETGVGTKSAERVFTQVLSKLSPDVAVSLGYCGALREETAVGDLVWASKVALISEGMVEERPVPDPWDLFSKLSLNVPIGRGVIVTTAKWMKKAEIARLVPSEEKLAVCDMETFALAVFSFRNGLPFFSVRSVSDLLATDLRFHPHAVCDPSGMYSLPRAVYHFLRRPHLLAHAAKLGRDSKTASRSLAQAITSLLRIL